MTDNDSTEIYIANVPEGTITVTPSKPDPEYLYFRLDERDLIGVRFEDKRVGSIFLALTPYTAQHVVAHLQGMLGRLDELRAESEERNQ